MVKIPQILPSVVVSQLRAGAAGVPAEVKRVAAEKLAAERGIKLPSAQRQIQRYLTSAGEKRGVRRPSEDVLKAINEANEEYRGAHTIVLRGCPAPPGATRYTQQFTRDIDIDELRAEEVAAIEEACNSGGVSGIEMTEIAPYGADVRTRMRGTIMMRPAPGRLFVVRYWWFMST